MLAPGLANLCWRSFRARRFVGPFSRFRQPTKEAFVLRTDAAFAAMATWEARSEAAWVAACQALVGGGGLKGFGCLEGTIGSGLASLESSQSNWKLAKLRVVQVCWLQGSQTCAGAGAVASECLL